MNSSTAQTQSRWLDWQRRRHLSRRDFAEYQFQSARGRFQQIAARIGQDGLRVLDVGCGLGGMSTAYAVDGAEVTAVDEQLYDPKSIRFAEEFARSKGTQVTFLAGSETEWELGDGAFDVVFMDSVIEHASNPERLLRESTRVLRPAGWMFISFPVYYGPFGGHIDDYVRLPWFHLLPKPVVRAGLRACRSKGDYVTPAFAEGMYLSLNRLTFHRFKRLLRSMPVEVVELRRSAFLTTPGNQLVFDVRSALSRGNRGAAWEALRRAPKDFGFWDACLFLMFVPTLPLMRVPLLQELFLGGIQATLRRRDGTDG